MDFPWQNYRKVNKPYSECSLRAVYDDFNLDLNQLLQKGNDVTVHQNNIRKLIIKVYKCLNN